MVRNAIGHQSRGKSLHLVSIPRDRGSEGRIWSMARPRGLRMGDCSAAGSSTDQPSHPWLGKLCVLCAAVTRRTTSGQTTKRDAPNRAENSLSALVRSPPVEATIVLERLFAESRREGGQQKRTTPLSNPSGEACLGGTSVTTSSGRACLRGMSLVIQSVCFPCHCTLLLC